MEVCSGSMGLCCDAGMGELLGYGEIIRELLLMG
jgi:hypothetical protein